MYYFSDLKLEHRVLLVLLLTIFINISLISIPGYYSHDELDWLNRIRTGNDGWGFGLSSISHSPFFRPLGTIITSITLRLPMQPFASHAALVFVQSLNCCALYVLVAEFRPNRALAAALLFAAMPGTAYAAGWIAASYDILYTLSSMVSLFAALRFWRSGHWRWMLLSFIAFSASLLCKEPAMFTPLAAILLIYCDRKNITLKPLIFLCSGISLIIILYAAFRIPVLMEMGQKTSNGGYTFGGVQNIIRNSIAYFDFAFIVPKAEIGGVLDHGILIIILAALIHIIFLLLIFIRYGIRGSFIYLAMYFIPLIPVLIISKHETQYLYATSIPMSVALAFLWSGRSVFCFMVAGIAAILIAHGAYIQTRMYENGVCQTKALDNLHSILPFLAKNSNYTIYVPNDTPYWVIARAVHENTFALGDRELQLAVSNEPTGASMIYSKNCGVTVMPGSRAND